MDPMTISALIAAGVQVGSAVLGYLMSAPDRAKAEQLIQQATDEYGQLNVPDLERAVIQEVGPTAFEKLQTDPRLKAAQYAALDRLEQSATEGLTLEDKAAQNEAMRAAARQESAGRQRIAEDFAARGQLGGGAQLAMQLQNQQQGAERAYDTSMQTAANAQRRMFDAMMQSGKLASELRGQEFDEQSRIAQARDAVNRYNADARRSGTQWKYEQDRQRALDRFNIGRAKADMAAGRGAQTQNFIGGLGSAGAQAATTIGKSQSKLQNKPANYSAYKRDEEDDPYRGTYGYRGNGTWEA